MSALLVTLELDNAAARTVLHALEFAMRRGAYMSGEMASLLAAHDDLLLALLAPEPEVVATCSPDLAAWLDPNGSLAKAGLLRVDGAA